MAQVPVPDVRPAAPKRPPSQILRGLDVLTEAVLGAMIVFSPWAFGTTQPWSMRLMNIGGYLIGGGFLAKVLLRRGFSTMSSYRSGARATYALLALTVIILAYVFISAANAEFTYLLGEFRFEPHPFVPWLPHSLDQSASWKVFRNWLALAGVFWAAHDWLIGDITSQGHRSSRRLRRMVFMLAINGALVALEGILQRTSGTARLLWFQPTHDNPGANAQFGPYAYRANAAQFFNLVWPIALGLWCQLQFHPSMKVRSPQRHHGLLPCVMLLMAAPLISLSRGGVAVTLVQMLACGLFVLVSRGTNRSIRIGIISLFIFTVAAAWFLGGEQFTARLHETAGAPLSGRGETYQLASRMARDYPWFGVGPGAFESVFQLYRNSPDDYWPAQLHNDWLEFLITFGRMGVTLLLAAGVLVAMRWLLPGGLRPHRLLVEFGWIAILGCLLHARFDFPLQIYSIQFVFVLLCAVLFSVTCKQVAPAT